MAFLDDIMSFFDGENFPVLEIEVLFLFFLSFVECFVNEVPVVNSLPSWWVLVDVVLQGVAISKLRIRSKQHLPNRNKISP